MAMELSHESKTETELEEWFLEGLEADAMPIDDMMAVLSWLAAREDIERAENWADLLQDTLADRRDAGHALDLLELRHAWRGTDDDFMQACRQALTATFRDRLGLAFLKNAGLDKLSELSERLRRLKTLTRLRPGILCHDKTWGLGVVKRLDDFYEKITLDFDKKPGHQMSFAYAGEALELVTDDHLLARKYRDPEALNDLVKNDPAEVVRITLRSYGPLSVPLLMETLIGNLLQESEWKSFWDAARKALKADPLVDVPARRNGSLRLLEKAEAYGETWFAAFKRERNITRLLEAIWELEKAMDVAELSDDMKKTVDNRLAFIILGAEGKRPDLQARAAMTAKRFGVSGGETNIDALMESLLRPDDFLKAISGLPAREVAKFLTFASDYDADKTSEFLLAALPRMPLSVLSEAVDFLVKVGKDQECAERFRKALKTRTAGIDMLGWACKHRETAMTWSAMTMLEVLVPAIDALEPSFSGEELKTQNQLRKLFEQKHWLEGVLTGMNATDRQRFLKKISGSRGWEATRRRSIMAKIIKLYPELKGAISSGASETPEVAVERGRISSWRSYRERQKKLRRLIEETIPQNSRDIGVARSYGDLSENFEYHAAKDQQVLLLSKKAELERDLQEVRGSDFAGFPSDKVDMGTSVTITRPNGDMEKYVILGEWDRDEDLDIIACQSQLAQRLKGHGVGEDVALPSASGDETCKITEVRGLSDTVKSWMAGTG